MFGGLERAPSLAAREASAGGLASVGGTVASLAIKVLRAGERRRFRLATAEAACGKHAHLFYHSLQTPRALSTVWIPR